MIKNIIVAGCGTDVGKTLASAVLTLILEADYWKPIQCGDETSSDSALMKQWMSGTDAVIHPPAYSLKAHLSPHHAARLENRKIELDAIGLPQTNRPLIIEGVGGVLVPLTTQCLSFDLFRSWNCQWVVVSRHYLGSINHTLLTVEALKQRHVPILGLIFNGEPNPESEEAILEHSQIPLLGRLLPESHLDLQTFKTYAKRWTPHFLGLLQSEK